MSSSGCNSGKTEQKDDESEVSAGNGCAAAHYSSDITNFADATSPPQAFDYPYHLQSGSIVEQGDGSEVVSSSHAAGTCSGANLGDLCTIQGANHSNLALGLPSTFVGGASSEFENGYPLVADLQQLRLQDEINMSIAQVIDQQAFHQEDMDNTDGRWCMLNSQENGPSVFYEESVRRDNADTTGEQIAASLLDNVNSVIQNDLPLDSDGQQIANVENVEVVSPQPDDSDVGSHEYALHNISSVECVIGEIPGNETSVTSGEESHTGWQASKSTLKERFAFLYCNELLADVWFIVGHDTQSQKIPAHRFILVTGSAVFDTMFNGQMAKSSIATASKMNQVIKLPDVEPSAFLALLKFLYTDEVSIEPETVMTTLYTAKKYAVPGMELACVDFLKRNLGADNAFMLLTQALLFDEPHLASLCLDVIDRNTPEALNADGFTDIDLDTLCMVLKRNTLRIREAPLFVAVLRWSSEECRRKALTVNSENQRMVLGRALYLIRFPLMTIDEFAQHAAQTGIMTDSELVSLFLYFTVNPKPQTVFLDIPRCCVFGKEVVVSRFQRVEGRWGYSGTPDRIKFTVDRKIYVLGFGLHGSIHGPYVYQVTIQILHCGTGKVLATNNTSFSCDGSCGTFRVLFKEPVEINPCVTYIASAHLRGPDSHYGTKGLRRIVHQSPSTGVVTFQFTYAAGDNNGTSVEDGQIPEIIFCTKII